MLLLLLIQLLEDWKNDDILDWMAIVNISRYAQIFRKKKIDGKKIRSINEEALEVKKRLFVLLLFHFLFSFCFNAYFSLLIQLLVYFLVVCFIAFVHMLSVFFVYSFIVCFIVSCSFVVCFIVSSSLHSCMFYSFLYIIVCFSFLFYCFLFTSSLSVFIVCAQHMMIEDKFHQQAMMACFQRLSDPSVSIAFLTPPPPAITDSSDLHIYSMSFLYIISLTRWVF